MKGNAPLYCIVITALFFAWGCGGDEEAGTEGVAEGGEVASDETDTTEGNESIPGEGDLDGEAGSETDTANGEGGEGAGGSNCACTTPEDCEEGQLCVPSGNSGVCTDFPPAGLCWDDSQCPFGATCANAVVCPCDQECLQASPGTCSAGSGCCEDDSDCIGGDVCANQVCKGLVGNKCWRDEDCGSGLECVGESICPCGSDCVEADAMGSCFQAGLNCCVSDLDCSFGYACLGEACVEVAGEMGCWGNEDCEAGEACVGAVPPCGCNTLCVESATMGVCEGPLECCKGNEECGDGEECIGGACRKPIPLQQEGTCWQDADCPEENAICEGAVLCMCGSLCQQPEAPGMCATPIDDIPQPEPTECCEDNTDCGDQICVLGMCKAVPEKGSCWTDADCKDTGGGLCEDAKVCPCGAPCATDPEAAPEKFGTCENAIEIP